MKVEYRYAESTVRPVELEITKTTVYLRKDIRTEERITEDNTHTFYVYQEAKMTPEEFNEYSAFMSAKRAITGENDSDNISALIAGQVNGDNNQLIIMEALADLYDAILNKI